MNRTTWPVLVAVVAIFAFPLSYLQAEDQLTVVEQPAELPPFILALENPQQVKTGDSLVVTARAMDRTNPEKVYSKKLSLTMLITHESANSSKEFQIVKGKAEIPLTLTAAGYHILTVRFPDDVNNNLKILASSSVRVLP